MIPMNDVRKVSGGSAKTTPVLPKAKEQPVFDDDAPAASIAMVILRDGVAAGASAVHIEPHHDSVHVRHRIDGLLHEDKSLPTDALKSLTKHFKRLANLDVSETRLPQDGRFNTTFRKRPYTIRVSILPVADGEKIVIHIVEQTGAAHDLEKLGYWGQALQAMQDSAESTRGCVLVGGPAGSGKTSTLYGLLGLAVKPSLSAVTIEDVVERRLSGITQTPVNTKANMTYAGTVRAVLHQDPNIIMMSDLRDVDSAGQALHAALGGRLVLAGVQSRDVAASLAHLVALYVEPYVLATALRVVVNQRLVRRLCPDCREKYTPSASEFDAICKTVGLPTHGVRAHITNLQSVAAADLNIAPASLGGSKVTLWRHHEQGCGTCGGRGYKGRIAIIEVMTVSPSIQKLIVSHASGAALYDQAMLDGMVPLPLDALVKVVLGLTSVDEVLHAI